MEAVVKEAVFVVAEKRSCLESADKAHEYVPQFIPEGRAYAFHVNLIAHGRQLCHPRNPDCGRCPLRRSCGYYRDNKD